MKGKIYFASDFHLGVPNKETSRERERLLVKWLDDISKDAAEVYLVGDLFDFWYEYKTVVPKGFVRFQAKIAELCDKGIQVHVFTGNHDMWMFNYFEEELGVKMHREPITNQWNGKKFFIGHGDGLGPGDHSYKFIKKVFSNPVCIWLFKWLHPDIGVGLANFWSGRSRHANLAADEIYNGDDKEWLLQFCKTTLQTEHFDYFIFGHRHLVLDRVVGNNSRYINLGHWFKEPHFAVWDGEVLKVEMVG
ncbi:MAG: UDP-2,3-diacylglucosamine diphosphatase [Flavobacteriales bacterium]|jgi:UDP-2,3-diacylglucosamine hydrolase|nr:UDP-2,3-diacylglucosamine diphosphatase [Flavobacteriales bacterium]